jgi:tetratricopeptide (TPR) repeat protein
MNVKLRNLLVFVLLSVIPLFSQDNHPKQDGANAGQFAIEGWSYLVKGGCANLAIAEKDFSQAVLLERGNADLHSRLGTVLMGEGLKNLSNCAHSKQERKAYLEHAWSEFQLSLNLDGSNVMNREAFVSLSEILKRKPEYDGGIAREPTKAELSQVLADHQAPKTPAASASLDSLESLEEAQLGDEKNKALASARESVGLKPTDGYAWYALGNAYSNLSDYKSAEESFKRAIDLFIAAPLDTDFLLRNGPNARQPALAMLANTELALADVYDHLNRKRDAGRYRRAALMLLPTTH